VDVHLSTPLGDGVFKGSLYLGLAREQLPPYSVDGSQIRSGSIGYDCGPLQFRLIHAESVLANSFMKLAPLRNTLTSMGATDAASAMEMKDTRSAYDSIGLTYDDGRWQLQVALNTVTHGTVLTENSKAGYLSLARRMGNVSPYLGYSWTLSSAKSLDTGLTGVAGAMINPQVAAVLKGSHQGQQTTTLGLRWDFAHNLDLKTQLDFVNGAADSTLLYDHVQSGWSGRTTVLSLALDFVFYRFGPMKS
jgi:hypothetical protein